MCFVSVELIVTERLPNIERDQDAVWFMGAHDVQQH
jgi:hypothetical protein